MRHNRGARLMPVTAPETGRCTGRPKGLLSPRGKNAVHGGGGGLGRGEAASGAQQFVEQKWLEQIFPVANFVVFPAMVTLAWRGGGYPPPPSSCGVRPFQYFPAGGGGVWDVGKRCTRWAVCVDVGCGISHRRSRAAWGRTGPALSLLHRPFPYARSQARSAFPGSHCGPCTRYTVSKAHGA